MGQTVADHLHTTPDRVLHQLDLSKDHLPTDLRVRLDEARELQALTALANPEVRDLRVESWLDQSYLDQLEREGFFERLAHR